MQENQNTNIRLRSAFKAKQQSKFREADLIYTSILNQDPANVEANLNMGLLAIEVSKFDKAAYFFERVIRTRPYEVEIWNKIIISLMEIDFINEAKAYFEISRSQNVYSAIEIKYFNNLFDNVPQGSHIGAITKLKEKYFTECLQLFEDGKFTESYELACTISRLHPEWAPVYNLIALNEAKLGNVNSAIEKYQKAISLSPNFYEAYNNLANTLKSVNKNLEAKNAYLKAIEINPKFAIAHYNFASFLSEKKRYPDAIGHLKNAVALEPKNVNFAYKLAEIYFFVGMCEDAILLLKNALKIEPDSTDTLLLISKVFRKMNNFDQAIAYINCALKSCNNCSAAYHEKAIAYHFARKYELAIDNYNRAIDADPNNSLAKFHLIELLKTYSQSKKIYCDIVDLDMQVKVASHQLNTRDSNHTYAKKISNILSLIQGKEPGLRTHLSQIHRRVALDLNCERHLTIFNKHNIIPEFCFNCYKVQLDLNSVLDMIRLLHFFYTENLFEGLLYKFSIELRKNVAGTFKGFIYCSNLIQAEQIRHELNEKTNILDLNFTSKIKHGCSEYALKFPAFANIDPLNRMKYPVEWSSIEDNFDRSNINHGTKIIAKSLNVFSLSDFLVIQKWLDFSKGVGDQQFSDIFVNPIVYTDIFTIGRSKNR